MALFDVEAFSNNPNFQNRYESHTLFCFYIIGDLIAQSSWLLKNIMPNYIPKSLADKEIKLHLNGGYMIRNQKLLCSISGHRISLSKFITKNKMFKIFRNGTVHAYHTGYLAANDDCSMCFFLRISNELNPRWNLGGMMFLKERYRVDKT